MDFLDVGARIPVICLDSPKIWITSLAKGLEVLLQVDGGYEALKLCVFA